MTENTTINVTHAAQSRPTSCRTSGAAAQASMPAQIQPAAVKVPKMASVAEVSEMFGVSQYFVRKLASSGKIKAVRISGRILVNVDKFTEFLNNSTLCDEEPEEPQTIGGIRRLY